MAYRNNANSRIAMATLSGLTGLVLALWVFDQVFEAIAPSFWTCASGFALNTSASVPTLSSATCYNLTNASDTAAGTTGYFGTTLSFVDDLLPVVGIIAGYIMIRMAIKRMTI